MASIQFRKSALDKISSLDQLDQTMKVVKPYDSIVVIARGIIVLAARIHLYSSFASCGLFLILLYTQLMRKRAKTFCIT